MRALALKICLCAQFSLFLPTCHICDFCVDQVGEKKRNRQKRARLSLIRGAVARGLTLTPDAGDDDDDDDCQLGEAFCDSGIRASERLFMLGALEWIVVERMQR